MLAALLPYFDNVIFTRFTSNPRAISPAELREQATRWLAVHPARNFDCRNPGLFECPDPATGWRQAQELAGPDDVICVAGSFFLAAEIRPLLNTRK